MQPAARMLLFATFFSTIFSIRRFYHISKLAIIDQKCFLKSIGVGSIGRKSVRYRNAVGLHANRKV